MKRKPAFGGLSLNDAGLLAAALVGLERQREEIESKMAEVRIELRRRTGQAPQLTDFLGTAASLVSKKGSMSAAGRRRIAAAQRKRWAAYHALETAAEDAPKPARKKRKLSAAGRKRIAEATKKRWAAFRAQRRAEAKRAARPAKKAAKRATQKKAAEKTVKKVPALVPPAEAVPTSP